MSRFEIASDPAELNRTLFEMTHGLYVLTALRDGKANGQCLDAAMQVTSSPPRANLQNQIKTIRNPTAMRYSIPFV